MRRIEEQAIQDIENSDEYSLRHYDSEIFDLVASYRHLVFLLGDSGVLQLEDDWAKTIQEHVEGVIGEEFSE